MHRSIGASQRISVSHTLSEANDVEAAGIFSILDDSATSLADATRAVRETIEEYLPGDWNVATFAICPTGDVLIGGLGKGKDGRAYGIIKCVSSKEDFVSCTLDKLDSLLEKSRQQVRMCEKRKTRAGREEQSDEALRIPRRWQ